MKKITLQIPMSWEQDRIDMVVRSYKDAGYEAVILPIAG